jgi:plastocyanin
VSNRSRIRVRRAPAAAALALAAVLVTGCGGDDAGSMSSESEETMSSSAPAEDEEAAESPAAGAGEEPEGATGTTLEVSSVDFSYELAEDSVSAGTYEVTLTNDGSASHNVVVERDGEDVAMSDVIEPGDSTTFEVTLEEGEYLFYCSVGNHRGMGMEIPVEVTA